jgi:hypothetical protein
MRKIVNFTCISLDGVIEIRGPGRLAKLSLADTTVLKSGVVILYELVSSEEESA